MINITSWRSRTAALCASASLVGVGLVAGVAGPAAADQFDMQNTAPVVTATTGGLTMQPAANGGSPTYLVEANVADAETLDDLASVTLCLSLTSTSNQNCTSPNPQTAVLITWDGGNDTFTVNDGSGAFWTNDASVSNYTATNLAMDMDFRFKVSEAAREGAWTARVLATDTQANSGNAGQAGTQSINNSVAYFGAVDTNRTGQDFGTVAPGVPANAINISNGTIQANGGTDISYAASAFTAGLNALVNRGGLVSDAPGGDQYAFDCNPAATFIEGNSFRVAATATRIAANVLATGTDEGGSSTLVSSCRLSSGGGSPVGTYSSTVTVTVAADA